MKLGGAINLSLQRFYDLEQYSNISIFVLSFVLTASMLAAPCLAAGIMQMSLTTENSAIITASLFLIIPGFQILLDFNNRLIRQRFRSSLSIQFMQGYQIFGTGLFLVPSKVLRLSTFSWDPSGSTYWLESLGTVVASKIAPRILMMFAIRYYISRQRHLMVKRVNSSTGTDADGTNTTLKFNKSTGTSRILTSRVLHDKCSTSNGHVHDSEPTGTIQQPEIGTLRVTSTGLEKTEQEKSVNISSTASHPSTTATPASITIDITDPFEKACKKVASRSNMALSFGELPSPTNISISNIAKNESKQSTLTLTRPKTAHAKIQKVKAKAKTAATKHMDKLVQELIIDSNIRFKDSDDNSPLTSWKDDANKRRELNQSMLSTSSARQRSQRNLGTSPRGLTGSVNNVDDGDNGTLINKQRLTARSLSLHRSRSVRQDSKSSETNSSVVMDGRRGQSLICPSPSVWESNSEPPRQESTNTNPTQKTVNTTITTTALAYLEPSVIVSMHSVNPEPRSKSETTTPTSTFKTPSELQSQITCSTKSPKIGNDHVMTGNSESEITRWRQGRIDSKSTRNDSTNTAVTIVRNGYPRRLTIPSIISTDVTESIKTRTPGSDENYIFTDTSTSAATTSVENSENHFDNNKNVNGEVPIVDDVIPDLTELQEQQPRLTLDVILQRDSESRRNAALIDYLALFISLMLGLFFPEDLSFPELNRDGVVNVLSKFLVMTLISVLLEIGISIIEAAMGLPLYIAEFKVYISRYLFLGVVGAMVSLMSLAGAQK
ncbi:hypothetical protein HDU76_003958, partial [Blyttiomyces sp. JEL0837]